MLTLQDLHRLRGVMCSLLVLAALGSVASASDRRMTPIVRAVQEARPSVVNIHGHKTVNSPNEDGDYNGPRKVNGMGTGVVIDERGYIITNHHVIDGVKRIQVTLADGKTMTARLVARDPQTDLAVIKINANKSLPLLQIGTSEDLMPGETVIAVGNAFGYHHSVTEGIVSALSRTVEVTDAQKYYNLIQTDASINPGNSGGPLVNIDGEMIGINVAVRVGAQGIGFAIPVDTAMDVAARLLRVEQMNGTWHGLMGESVMRDGVRSYIVHGVHRGSPADKAGIKAGDYVRKIEGTKIERSLDVERALMGVKSGTQVTWTVDRDDSEKKLNVQLADAPASRTGNRMFVASKATGSTRVRAEVWQLLGLKVTPARSSDLAAVDPRYNGGLKIEAVRPNSSAEVNGIRSGDILVGMHVWETISLDNLDYILNRANLEDPSKVRFHVVRGGKTLAGNLPVIRR